MRVVVRDEHPDPFHINPPLPSPETLQVSDDGAFVAVRSTRLPCPPGSAPSRQLHDSGLLLFRCLLALLPQQRTNRAEKDDFLAAPPASPAAGVARGERDRVTVRPHDDRQQLLRTARRAASRPGLLHRTHASWCLASRAVRTGRQSYLTSHAGWYPNSAIGLASLDRPGRPITPRWFLNEARNRADTPLAGQIHCKTLPGHTGTTDG
jgi:hypothetical protein